MIITILTR